MVFREGLSETFGTVPIAGARIEVKPGGRIRRLLLVLRKLTTMTMPMMNGVTSKSKRIKKSTSSADDCGGFSAVSDGTTLSSSATTTTKLLADDERLLHQQWKNCGDLRFYTVALFFVTQASATILQEKKRIFAFLNVMVYGKRHVYNK
jgi:hypothetical protein